MSDLHSTPHSGRSIIAVANQKGGVGKTTTAINIGAVLSSSGLRVLVVDLDPQGNASTGLGVFAADRELTTYDIMLRNTPVADVMVESEFPNLWIAPSTVDLSSTDVEMMTLPDRAVRLRAALSDPALRQMFDIVLIDCPPSLNLLTVNAMVAADSVLVPLQCEFFALEGLSQLLATVRDVRQSHNPGLEIEGVVLTMYDGRNNLARQVEDDVRQTLGDVVFKTIIPRNVRLSEAPSFSMPVVYYDPGCAGSKAYEALAIELAQRIDHAA